ncbi:MAG: TonB family protein [Myxococcota bacterium]
MFSVGLHALFVHSLWDLEPEPATYAPPAEEVTVVFREPVRPAPLKPVAAKPSAAPAKPSARARRAAPAQDRHVVTAPPRATEDGEPRARRGDDEGAGVGEAPGERGAGSTGGEQGGGAQRAVAPRVEVMTPARVLSLPTIEYPPAALTDELEGQVRLWVVLDARGQLVRVEVLSEPGGGLGAAARAALLRGRFEPARRGAEPIPSAFEYVYRFELR